MLDVLRESIAPRARGDANADHLLEWAESILELRDARVLHAYYGPVGWRTLALKRRLGLPLVVTLLGDDLGPTVPAWWSWWYQVDGERPDWPARRRELFDEADLVLAEVCSPTAGDQLGCPPEKVAVQRIALPLDEITPRRLPREGARRPTVVFAGRFSRAERFAPALAAIRALRVQHHDVELRVVGDETMTDGAYAARVYAYVREHRLEDNVPLLGFLDHDACLAEMRLADVFLAPSIVDDAGVGKGRSHHDSRGAGSRGSGRRHEALRHSACHRPR